MAKLRKKQKGGPGNTVKKIGKELLQTATPINMLDIAGLLPANLKAFAADLTGIGKSEGITEKDLNKKEKKALKEAIARAEKAGKNRIEYFDYNTTGTPKTKNEDIGGGSFKGGLAPITKYFDPSYSMKTMLGQTGFKKNKDGSYTITDQYDFNDAKGAGFKGFIADASKAEGIEKFNPYRVLRSAARNFGSAPGKGMDVNINLKQTGGVGANKEMGNLNPITNEQLNKAFRGVRGQNYSGNYEAGSPPVDFSIPPTAMDTVRAYYHTNVGAMDLLNKVDQDAYKKLQIAQNKRVVNEYQAGGLATPPMYGSNTIPGSPETAAITYQEADKARVKALEQELEETRTSTKYMDEAEANMSKQQATIDSIEQALGQGVEKADELGAFDKLKAKGAEKAADKLKQEALAKGTTLSGGVSDDALKALAPKLFEKPATSLVPSSSSLPSNLANFTPKSITIPNAPLSLSTQGTSPLSIAGTTGTTASKGLVGSVGPGGVGAIASLAGEGIKMASDDQDATTMNAGESIGSGLSGVGTGIGAAMTTAALMGSSLGPLGTAAGAIGGAVYGLGKGLIQRGKARRETAKAEKKQERDENKLATAQKLEALKSRMYSGYDMGADIARYGGYYQMGGNNQNVQIPTSLLPGIQKRMNTPMSSEEKTRYGSLQMQRDASDYLAKEGTMAGFKRPEETSGLAKTGKFIAKEALLDKAFHGLGRFAGVPGLLLSPMEAGASTVRDPYGVPMRKPVVKNRNGGVKLPGGVAKPIPGSDAIEFKGRSHEQGGIMIDPNTEVEGDETMDKVTMKNGGKNDYFFSQHLKLGGKSFAQRHKDLLKNGGTQGEIDYLAKLQEEKAGRDPDDVKLGAGGYKMYLDGGVGMDGYFDPLGNQMQSDANIDGLNDFTQDVSFRTNPIPVKYYPGTSVPVQDENNFQYAESEEEPSSEVPAKPKERVPDENFEFNYMEPKSINQIPVNNASAPGTYVDLQGNTVTPQMGPEEFDYDSLSQEDKNVIDKANSGQGLTDLEKKALKRLNRDVPGLAIAAGVGQLIAPAYAFFKKDRVAEQMGAPGRIKAPALDRVNYNAERASNAAQNRAISRSIDTSGAGPAGIMAKMASYRRKQEGDIKIAAAESRANIGIANQEAQMEMQANARNVANAMQADQINTQLRERQLAANEDRKLGAIDSFTERTAGLAGDLMSYKANERLARATGDMGIYERDRLRNFLSKEINPRTKKPYTNAEIAQLFNIRFGEAQPTKETKEKENE